MANAWYRFYVETLDDPKVQKLPGEQFKGWVNLLSLAARNEGDLPPVEDIAFALRMSEKDAQELIDNLIEKGLIDENEIGLEPHNWNGRQYKSDVSTERVKRFRKRHETVSETPNETPPEQNRTDSDTETEQKKTATRKRVASKRGTRIPDDWKPDEIMVSWALIENPGIDLKKTIDSFTDYWRAKAGAAAVKLDWDATFRNWVRRQDGNTNRTRESSVQRSERIEREHFAKLGISLP